METEERPAFTDLMKHIHIGLYLTIVMMILSIFGAIGILVSYIKCPQERNTLRQLLLLLTLADCLVACSHLAVSIKFLVNLENVDGNNVTVDTVDTLIFHNTTLSPWCVTLSFVSIGSSLVSIFYNISIAVYFYTVAVINSERTLRGKVVWIHVVCWVIPFCVVIVAVGYDALGANLHDGAANTGPWCSINGHLPWWEQVMWMLLARQVWEYLAYILGPVFWILVIYEMYQNRPIRQNESRFSWINVKISNGNSSMRFREDDWNFRYIPLIFYLLRMWGTVRFIITVTMLEDGVTGIPQGVLDWIYVMKIIGDNAQGFVNFLLFCVVDRKIRRQMWWHMCWRNTNTESYPIMRYSNTDSSGSDGL